MEMSLVSKDILFGPEEAFLFFLVLEISDRIITCEREILPIMN
jgi:hypothetical protein